VDVDGHAAGITPEVTHDAITRLLENIEGYCDSTAMPVPAIVCSGRGVHLYWWFEEAIDLYTAEEKDSFKQLLKAAGQWISGLILWDPFLSSVWSVDPASSSVFHLMNLPGTINPSSHTPRYVANGYGVDYKKTDFDSIRSSLLEYTAFSPEKKSSKCLQPRSPKKASFPKSEVILVQGHDSVAMLCASSWARKPYSAGRLGRLLSWAAGKNWRLEGQRESFLFICGCLLQQMAGGVIEEDRHALLEINNFLATPLDSSEVFKIIYELNSKFLSGADPYSRYYLYQNRTIALMLNMTEDESNAFIGYRTKNPGVISLPSVPNFKAKLCEIFLSEPRLETESIEDHRARCYRLTLNFYSTYRKEYPGCSNRARSRKRAANRLERQKKRVQDAENCKKLRAEGASIRKIADALGLKKSAVQRLLKGQ
jgi:hypothetical protein